MNVLILVPGLETGYLFLTETGYHDQVWVW